MGDPRSEQPKYKTLVVTPDIGAQNLEAMFARADKIDREEGLVAYNRYRELLLQVSKHHGLPFAWVVGAFCALSPNNDYLGNLRSLLTLIKGLKAGRPVEDITVSTYRHCAVRSYSYLKGVECFPVSVNGPKILAFYWNIIDPDDDRWVTIDGHMVAAYNGAHGATMKDSIIDAKQYRVIADVCTSLAETHKIKPCQYQAIIWFTRKRVLRIRYDPQIDIFAAADGDVWKICRDIERLETFPIKGL